MGKAVAALLALILSTGYSVPMPPIYQLGWLSGHWVQRGPDYTWSEEYWTYPTGDLMLGAGLSGKGLTVENWEFMRIDGNLTFWASPKGGPPVAFQRTDSGRDHVTFENPKHDYPTRISYRLEGQTLVATISGPRGAKARTWRYRQAGDPASVISPGRKSAQ
jgi:hypothetical protein